jgi:hypothetical protein
MTHILFDNPIHGRYHFVVDAKDKEGVKQPENLVQYKSKKELYSTVHACIMLRELPELTPEELQRISDREQSPE